MIKRELVAHASNNNDDDKYPKDHIKVEIAASASAVVLIALRHCEPLLSKICSIYYESLIIFVFCPQVLLEFFIKMGYNSRSNIFYGR